ncbi:MAG TPA: hypothetical protein VMZ91_05985 [Candidatus Paceibacterota bacterium]|nr:hypothetical protein [Candidatus Paceibacterota bacterium]
MKNRKRKVKAHKRFDPRINKKVDVSSYQRNQKFTQYKSTSKKSKIPQLRCFYCGKDVNIGELRQIDKKLGKMEGEDREFLMDNFPKTTNPRKKPYVHKSDLGYDVLNICEDHLSRTFNDSDLDVDRLIEERESTYKKLSWVDNKIALKERQIRKIEKTKPLKAKALEEDIRELTEDQEMLGELIDKIDHDIEGSKDNEDMEW